MKKAQITEFISMMLMVIVIVIFVMFNRLGSTRTAIDEAERLGNDFENENMWQGANVLMLTKISGMDMSELIGIMVCNKVDVVTTSKNQKINISELTFKVLNNYYGQERWALELYRNGDAVCLKEGHREQKCDLPSGDDIKAFNFLFPLPCGTGFGEGVVYVWR